MWFYNYHLTNIWNKILQNGTIPFVAIQTNFDDYLFVSIWWSRDGEDGMDHRGGPLSWKPIARFLYFEDYIDFQTSKYFMSGSMNETI